MKTVPTASLLLYESDIYHDSYGPTFYERLVAGAKPEDQYRINHILLTEEVKILIKPEDAGLLPENLGFLLTDSFVSLGFGEYNMSDDRKLELARDFCRNGVTLTFPGTSDRTNFILRRFLPMFALLEPVGSNYAPPLPPDWADKVKIT